MAGKAQFKSSNTYIEELTGPNRLEVYVSGTKSMTIETDGGQLHGSWNVESSLVTSDSRLKTNILPLQHTLRDVIAPKTLAGAPPPAQPGAPGPAQPATAAPQADGALWLLRELRPVSYSFKKGSDSKYMRFGFIADELETVVPQVVRTVGDRDVSSQKAVAYQDLIALLAAAAQSQQGVIDEMKRQQEDTQRLYEATHKRFDTLKAEIERLKQDELEMQRQQSKEEELQKKKRRRRRRLRYQRR